MNHSTNFSAERDQTNEDVLYEVSDETLEEAAGIYLACQARMTGGPTIMMGGCC